MKKRILQFMMVLLITVLMFGCNQLNEDKVFRNEESELSYQVLSSMKLLETNNQIKLGEKNTNDVVEEKEQLDKYLLMMDDLLNTNGGFKTVELESDKTDYQKLLRTTIKNLEGTTLVYDLYFNEEIIKSSIEGDMFDDEVETKIKISGIAILNDTTFELSGYKEIEEDGNEKEYSTKYIISKDQFNYVIVSNEIETEYKEFEEEYSYEVYSNGKKVSKIEYEIEKENNRIQIKLREVEGKTRNTYTFNLVNRDEEKYIHIKIQSNGNVKHIKALGKLNSSTLEYEYVYKYMLN